MRGGARKGAADSILLALRVEVGRLVLRGAMESAIGQGGSHEILLRKV